MANAHLAVLYIMTLGWMTSLAPQRDHEELAWAVAMSADSIEEAALVTAMAFRESSFRNDVVSEVQFDGRRSYCAMQIHGAPELVWNVFACIERGVKMLRESTRVDKAFPVSFYARGPRWKTEEARSYSRDRTQLAAKLLCGSK